VSLDKWLFNIDASIKFNRAQYKLTRAHAQVGSDVDTSLGKNSGPRDWGSTGNW